MFFRQARLAPLKPASAQHFLRTSLPRVNPPEGGEGCGRHSRPSKEAQAKGKLFGAIKSLEMLARMSLRVC